MPLGGGGRGCVGVGRTPRAFKRKLHPGPPPSHSCGTLLPPPRPLPPFPSPPSPLSPFPLAAMPRGPIMGSIVANHLNVIKSPPPSSHFRGQGPEREWCPKCVCLGLRSPPLSLSEWTSGAMKLEREGVGGDLGERPPPKKDRLQLPAHGEEERMLLCTRRGGGRGQEGILSEAKPTKADPLAPDVACNKCL